MSEQQRWSWNAAGCREVGTLKANGFEVDGQLEVYTHAALAPKEQLWAAADGYRPSSSE